MSNCIIVLGMQQGGISIVAGLLKILGINFGENRFLLSKDNSAFFFENQKILRVNENILESLNSSYDDLRPLPAKWWQEMHLMGHKKEIISIIEKELNDESVMFAIKDARLSRLLPLWIAIFSELALIPHFVIMVRNPLEVAYSLEKRNGFSIEKSMSLWMTHMLDAEYYSREFPRTFQSFEGLISDPEESVHQISKRLSIEFPQAYENVKSDIEKFLEPALTHHQSNIAEKNSLMSTLIFDYYRLLKAASQKAALMEDDLSRIDNIKTKFSQIRSYFSNHELEAERRRLEDHVDELEMKQVIFRKQIEDHIGLQRRREAVIAGLEQKIIDLEQKVDAQNARLGELYKANSDLELIYGSRSWKITEPLRAIAKFFREHFPG